MKQYTRVCPECKESLSYKTYRNWWAANKKNSVCISCCQKGKPAWNKIEVFSLSRVCPKCKNQINYSSKKSYRRAEKLSGMCRKCNCENYNSKRVWTEKSLARIRDTKARKRFERGEYGRCYRINKNSFSYFDGLSEKMGWNLIHGGNGGEKLICGYWVDSYDEKNNIIVEYDEPFHYPYGKLRSRDVIRQNRIIALTGCRFFRYNERENTLYEVTGKC